MKFLIDTNIFIPLEPTSVTDLEVNTNIALQFDQVCSKAKCEIFIHPAISRDINSDKNADRRTLRTTLLQRYSILQHPPPASIIDSSIIPYAEEGSHDWVDNSLLAAIHSDLADYLVTEDTGIHKKAKKLGLESRVLLLNEALTTVQVLFQEPSSPPPMVMLKYVYQLNSSDLIFDSLRSDYDGFDKWFAKCKRNHRQCYVSESSDGSIAGLVIFKEEHEIPDGTKGKTLKICTFKVSEKFSGNKIGELLLKPILKFAKEGSFDFVYLTTYPKQGVLISFLYDFGFFEVDNHASVNELAFCKSLKYPSRDMEEMTPLEFHVRYGPYVTSFNGNKSFFVPILPTYHTILFPELSPRPVSLFSQETKPCGNAIRKAYLCNASSKAISPGDNLFFYRSGDFSSITCLGIVEDTMRSLDPETIARYVGKRTVYSLSDIESLCRKREVLAILFRIVTPIEPKISLQTLMSNGIMKKAPQSISSLKEAGIQWLRQQIGM